MRRVLVGTVYFFFVFSHHPLPRPLCSYSICIRRERGFCCVRYSPCADAADPFTLDTSVGGIAGGFTDNDCGDDYVGIEGAGYAA